MSAAEDSRPAHDDLPKIDKYDVQQEIGHGGMATVYRAKDLRLGRDVAIKIIHRHLRDNGEVATRFVAEARAAAKLKHRGIVEVYDVSSETDRERFLVVELINGKTLRQALVDDREMPPELGAAIVLELCEAVSHAHEAGVIHRDIKPENVLIGLEHAGASRSSAPSEGDAASEPVKSAKSRRAEVSIKLTDFGIAKILDAQGVTSTGQVLGSPAHMAPEQIDGGDVGVKTDVFALGVILYECLVGHLPFEGKNPAQVLRRVIEGDYAPAEHERAAVGAIFGKIVAGALATDVADRIADPDALAELLRAELGALGITDHRAELAAYFEDPTAYRAAHRERIVPLLIARGESARKQRVTHLAAAHFNRAHALSPDDPTILRRIAGLGASASRARLLRRGVAVLGTAAVVGGITYLAIRELRAGNPQDPRLVDTAPPVGPTAEPEPVETGRAAPPPTSTAAPSVIRTAAAVRIATSAPSASSKPSGEQRVRPVTFVVTPKNASLLVDGFPTAGDTQVMLTVGSHSIQVGPPANDPCCAVDSGSIMVPEPNKDDPNAVYRIPVKAKLLKAKVKLVNAPPGGTAVCQGVQITASETEVEPITYPWMANCSFNAPGQEQVKAVRSIFAGRAQNMEWPPAAP